MEGAIPPVSNWVERNPADLAVPNLPAEYAGQSGRVTAEKTLPQLQRFLEAGGTIIAIGDSAANLAAHLNLSIQNHLAEKGAPHHAQNSIGLVHCTLRALRRRIPLGTG